MNIQEINLELLGPRFWAKVERIPFTDCWLWVGAAKNKSGHGVIGMGTEGAPLMPAHRLAYMLKHNLRDVGDQHTLHRCDNPWCVNPDHLYLGTHQDNMRDARLRGQLGKGRNSGLANGSNCKLTEDQVRLVRQTDLPRGQLSKWAREWGISNTQLSSIRGRRKWTHI